MCMHRSIGRVAAVHCAPRCGLVGGRLRWAGIRWSSESAAEKSGVRLRYVTHDEEFQKEIGRRGKRLGQDTQSTEEQQKGLTKAWYICISVGLFMLGGCFLSVPLYRLYCTTSPQAAGSAAQKAAKHQEVSFNAAARGPAHVVNVLFNSDLGSPTTPVMFVPLQSAMEVLLGEPALAFFNVYNKTDKTIIGLTTYNVAPAEAAPYFNKIQCFCFEEQRIKPRELIEMPVFFYVDKEYRDDISTATIKDILLNYTFFAL
eukprot:TRINITY_DN33065_c0_g1_i1.p1 TRINITY_DN33065_c0_g1~~TRINITY_DN33065_c0_g1_i1.p1  ORF type:complete len:258 (+),score=48.39 TRINITY_DN33065_c0_g1_i1:46-819(+)